MHRALDRRRDHVGDPGEDLQIGLEATGRQRGLSLAGEVEGHDRALGALVEGLRARGLLDETLLIVTADHGNADQMYGIDKVTHDYTTTPHTSHSLNPVPVWLYDPHQNRVLGEASGPTVTGGIAQIGGTVLDLHGIPPPVDYLPSLLRKT